MRLKDRALTKYRSDGSYLHFMQAARHIIITALFCLAGLLAEAQLPKLIPYKTAQGWGYSDSSGILRLPAVYAAAGLFRDGLATVIIQNADSSQTYCRIDEAGNFVIPPQLHWTGYATRGFAGARFNVRDSLGRWGIADERGNILTPSKYDMPGLEIAHYPWAYTGYRQMGYTGRWYLMAKHGGEMGVVDTLDRTVIPFIYDTVMREYDHAGDVFAVKTAAGWGAVNSSGRVLFPPKYEVIHPFHYLFSNHGLAQVKRGGKMGVIDTSGRVVVPLSYDTVELQGGETGAYSFITRLNGKQGWSDSGGGHIIPARFEGPVGPAGFGFTATQQIHDGRPTMILLDRRLRNVQVPPGTTARSAISEDLIEIERPAKAPEGSVAWETAIYSLSQRQIVKHWQRQEIKLLDFSSGGYCGTGRAEAAQFEAWERRQPHIDSMRRYMIFSFAKDGKHWEVMHYADEIHSEKMLSRHEYVAVFNRRDSLWGIVNQQREWVVQPQNRYAIKGGDFKRNCLIVTRDGKYAVTDSSLRPVTAFTPREITGYAVWQSKPLVFAYRDTAYRYVPTPPSPWQGEVPAARRAANCSVILDAAAHVRPEFNEYCSYQYKDSMAGGFLPYLAEDFILATDTARKRDLLLPDGSCLLPAWSRKYKSTDIITYDLFLTDGVYRNREDIRFAPELRLTLDGTEYEKLFFSERNGASRTDLIPFSTLSASGKASYLFLSRRGKVFADPEALE